MQTSLCRKPGCGRKIVWAVTANGKRMPLDAEPSEAGNVACYRVGGGNLIARVLAKGQTPDQFERLYQPHFATCEPHLREQTRSAEIKRANRVTPGVVVPMHPRSVAGRARR